MTGWKQGSAILGAGFGVVVMAFATSEGYVPPAFEAYRPILNRMPFGALPANFNAVPTDPAVAQNEAQVKAEQQKLAKQVNMSAVNVTPEGETAIGFTDLSEKPPVNYYLLVGAEGGGWKVVDADYDEETATIEKDGIRITLKLGQGLVDTAAPAAQAAGPKEVPPGVHRNPLLQRASLLTRTAGGGPGGGAPPPAPNQLQGSYKDRLLERRKLEVRQSQAAAQEQQDQLVKLAREAAQKEIQRREEEAVQSQDNEAATGTAEPEALPADAPLEPPQ